MCLLCVTVLSCSRSHHNEEPREREPNMVDVLLRLDFAEHPESSAPAPAVSKSVTDDMFELNVSPMGVTTKANATNLERQIHNLNIFFVRERYTGGDDTKTVKHIYLTESDLTVNEYGSQTDIVIKDVYLGPYVMYMMANVGDLSNGGSVKFTPKQLNDFKFDLAGVSSSEQWVNRGLPMYSKDRVDIKFAGDNIVPISGKLDFAVSKVKFNCKIKDELFGTGKIYISSVSLKNFADSYAPFAASSPIITPYSPSYAVIYSQSDNKQSAEGCFYVYSNPQGNVDLVDDPRGRNVSNAPPEATYLYVETTFGNAINNSEIYGFYIYLGKDNDVSNFDTDVGNLYNTNVNINGLDPESDSRISSLTFGYNSSSWRGWMAVDTLCTFLLDVKAQNLKGQQLNLTGRATPAFAYNKPNSSTMDLREADRLTVLTPYVKHPNPLLYSLPPIDTDNLNKSYAIGFTAHIHIPLQGNPNLYPLTFDLENNNGVKSTVIVNNISAVIPPIKP